MIEDINFKKGNGIIPAVIQHYQTGEVLMVGMMNKEAVLQTTKDKRVTFFSRTKNRLWQKGETSGNFLDVISIALDCDKDALVIKVDPSGPTCHTGERSCFINNAATVGEFISELEQVISERIKAEDRTSYVKTLHSLGTSKIAQKVGEEAVEVVTSALSESSDRLVEESADLLFHLLVLLGDKNRSFTDVIAILKERRAEDSGRLPKNM